jgi:2-polyprenyl-3-methyl-5-hydroxy-6-metoxy-1,4-benzoquinol methylase
MAAADLCALLDSVDIYLLDQLVRGRLTPGMRTLDAGCGGGRNLRLLLELGFDVWASDEDARAVESVRRLAATIAPKLPATNFRTEPVERSTFDAASFDAILSSAVLHFARDDAQFSAMVAEMWRLLRGGGLLFCRLASTIGMEDRMQPLGGRRFVLPDGSERYLVDEARLLEMTRHLGGMLVDPLKTTVVQDQRCMTTWVLRKT